MSKLDRYVLRNFLEPFFLCFAAFLGILLIFDLNDNLTDFLEAKSKLKLVGVYYLHQLPRFVLLSMPLGLLLALLFSLSKMSRSNEIISMLSAGRSVVRVIAPLIIFGILTTGACLLLNYRLAPQADAVREADIKRISKGEKKAEQQGKIEGHLFKDRMNNRIWYVQEMQLGNNHLDGVHISQLDSEGNVVSRWYAKGAIYNPQTKTWNLNVGRKVNFDTEGNIVGEIEDWTELGSRGTRSITGWTETPWRIASSSMIAENLSVPELRDYIRFNSDFTESQLAPFKTHLQYRWALPFACLSVVFIAAPLGIVMSRRAVLASVASSIFIFFGFLFLMFLFLALGKGAHVSPVVAGWFPTVTLFVIGVYLLYLRNTSREFPKFGFGKRRS